MFLRNSFILLFLSFHSLASAFALVGGYERVSFYYAYVMDCTANGGNPKNVATGCAKAMQTSGKPCSFDQFVEFMAKPVAPKTGPDPINYPRITGQPYSATDLPDLDRTAQRLEDLGLNVALRPKYLHKNMKTSLFADALKLMAEETFRLMDRDNVSDNVKRQALAALEQIFVMRRDATWREFAKFMLDKTNVEVPEKRSKVHPDSTREFLDFTPVAREYSKKTGLSMKDLGDAWKESADKALNSAKEDGKGNNNNNGGDGDNSNKPNGHLANNEALKNALVARYNQCSYE